MVQDVFSTLTYPEAVDRLTDAQTAYGAINSVHELIEHPQLRTLPMQVNGLTALIPALPYVTSWDDERFAEVPRLGQHSESLRAEFPAPPKENKARQ